MITMSTQQYCLRWNNHQPNFISVFSSLLNSESLVDVTLSAEGRHLQAHKLVLSACSAYFQSLFTINPCQHPIVILKDVKFNDLKVIIDFMYYGEVNVSQDQLPYILKTAEMLKIKGLAEIPVEASMKQNNLERPEVLTTDTGWGHNDVKLRQSLSPSPCSLSPGSKRKRLRKSSTGSGSGSTERPCDDHSNNEVTLTSPLGVAIIKPDPMGFQTESNNSQRKQGENEITRGSSQESVESESPHQITLQVPQQEISVQHNVESSASLDIPGSSTTSQQTVTDRILITTHAQFPQSSQQTTNQMIVGTKRGRFLMRQSRIKKEMESLQNPESASEPMSAHYLSVPHVRVERQVSDPLPTISSHSPPPGHLLTVPGTNILVKQHSHPLLPSQTCHSPPSHQTSPVPGIQVFSQTNFDCERTSSPTTENFQQESATLQVLSSRSKTEDSSSSSLSLRVKSEELKRSISSPSQTNTRSSHCPVVRPGPALGCNYCWNTVDTHGRILRRKTKYHCPECQTNLCIVPCFQEYHERHVAQTDPIALTTSVMRVFPKTTSM